MILYDFKFPNPSNAKYFWLCIILGLGFFLRIYKLDDKGISYDEKSSVSCAVGIPHAAITAVKSTTWQDLGFQNNIVFHSKDFWKFNTLQNVIKGSIHSHGYFITLHYWINIFGISDFSVRFLSVIFSSLIILLVYVFTNELLNSPKISLWASLFTSINPILIESGQFTRSHTMVVFFTLLSTYFFFKVFIQKNKSMLYFWGYTFGVLISIFSHFYCAYIFLGHCLIMMVYIREKKIWFKYFSSNSIVVFLYMLYLFKGGVEDLKAIESVNLTFKSISENWKEGDNTFYLPSTLNNLIAGWIQVILPMFGNSLQNFGIRLREIVFLLIVPLGLLSIGFNKTNNFTKKNIYFLILILLLMSPVFSTIMAIKSNYIIFFGPFYSAYSVPYAMILLAVGYAFIKTLRMLEKYLFYFLTALQITLMTLSLVPFYENYPYHKPHNQYIALANNIKDKCSSNDTIIYSNWEDAQITNLYLKKYDYLNQKVDTTYCNKVILIKSSGKKTELINDTNKILQY